MGEELGGKARGEGCSQSPYEVRQVRGYEQPSKGNFAPEPSRNLSYPEVASEHQNGGIVDGRFGMFVRRQVPRIART